MTEYKFNPDALLTSSEFSEASANELRVLLTLVANGSLGVERISEITGLSSARVKSAIVLFEDAGILKKCDTPPALAKNEQTVTEHFEERITLGAMHEITASACAKDIRDNSLASLLAECAALMGKAALSTEEAKMISATYTQLALSEDYIITLAAYITEKKGKLTAVRLSGEAEKLVKGGIDTTEALEKYISDKESETGAMWEFKRILGIYNRNLTKREAELVNRWYSDFGYGEAIIGEAYDITVMNTGKLSLAYMDKLITRWHECDCKTVEDCKRVSESEKPEKKTAEEKKAPPRMPRTPKSAPRYGNFDVDDAFKKALMRSYGDPELVEKMLKRDGKN